MASEKQTCPLCGTKLKMIDGQMKCKQCGYYVREQTDQANLYTSSQYGGTGQQTGSTGSQTSSGQQTYSTRQQTSSGQQTYSTGQQPSTTGQQTYSAGQQTSSTGQQAYSTGQQTNSTGQQTYSTGQTRQPQISYTYPQNTRPQYTSSTQNGTTRQSKSGSSTRLGLIIGITAAVVVCVVMVSTFIFAFHMSYRDNTIVVDPSELEVRTPTEAGNSASESTGSSLGSISGTHYMPSTDFFRDLAEAIFGKPCDTISQEEFASILALSIDTYEQTVYYRLDDNTEGQLTYTHNYRFDFSDLQNFPSLFYISLEGDSFNLGDLRGLENLACVFSDNTLNELAAIIPHPENIVQLGYEASFASFLDTDLSGIDQFPNLGYLSVDASQLTDISALKDYPDLWGLELLNCNSLMDYSPLMSMTALETLAIQSNQLKTIDFIQVMPNLTYLKIEDSQISDISAISSCPELTQLYLIDNYNVMDYAPVGDLVHLTDLTLFKTTHATIPSLENLTALERASFKNLWENGELSLIAAAPNISRLYLESCYDDDLSVLTSLPLTYLTMRSGGASVSQEPLLKPLTQLPLEYLDLSDLYVFGNIEEIFGIPTLRYLYLDEGNGVIDFDNVATNENLVVLSMNGYNIHVAAFGDGYQYLSDHYDFFDHFPNLVQLHIADMSIDSIEFVEKLPNLQFLDITQNNVTSLKPLESLSNFQTVWCGYNTILEPLPEDSDIEVDMESYYSPY